MGKRGSPPTDSELKFMVGKNHNKMIKKIKKERIIPTRYSMPELRMRTKLGQWHYITNEPFPTRYRYWPVYPDVLFLDFPLIIEVNGIHWHSKKAARKKDAAKYECYLGEGYYVFVVSDLAVNTDLDNVYKALCHVIDEAKGEEFGNPHVYRFDDP